MQRDHKFAASDDCPKVETVWFSLLAIRALEIKFSIEWSKVIYDIYRFVNHASCLSFKISAIVGQFSLFQELAEES